MSVEATTVVLHHSKAEGSAKLVLWGIANHHSDAGSWPAISTLAKYANIKERRVQQIIRQLADMGEISIDEQGGYGEGQYKTNRYHILLQCPPECDGTLNHKTGVQSVTSGVHSVTSGVQSVTVRGAIQSHSGVQPIAPEPNKNLIEPLLVPAKGAHRLPKDWKPSSETLSVMAEHFPNIDLKLEMHKFKDYWAAATRSAMKKDWDAAFRNWIRNAAKFQAEKEPTTIKRRIF